MEGEPASDERFVSAIAGHPPTFWGPAMSDKKSKKVKKAKSDATPDIAICERVKYKSCIKPPAERVITYYLYKTNKPC